MSLKKQPWTTALQEFEEKETLNTLAYNKFNSGLLAKYFLNWIGALVQKRKKSSVSKDSSMAHSRTSVCENKENKSANENSMIYFTFAKKEHGGRDEFGKVEEFVSTAPETHKTYAPSSRRLDQLFDNLSSDEGGYRLQLKYLRKWKRLVLNARHMRAEKERRMENWLVAINFYEQTLCSKGLLGLLHHKQSLLRLEQMGGEMSRRHRSFLLGRSLQIWRAKNGI